MTQTKYFDSQVFEQDSEITESEAKARGIYVRAFMDEHGNVYKAEVVRDHQVTEVVYHGVEGELDIALREQHRAAYPGVPFQMTGAPVATEQEQERRKERYDAGGTLTEVVIEVLDDRGELLTEFRRDPSTGTSCAFSARVHSGKLDQASICAATGWACKDASGWRRARERSSMS